MEPRFAAHSVLPLRQHAGACIPHILSFRPGRLAVADTLSQGRADQSFGACGRSRTCDGKDRLGRLRLFGGPVFRHSFLGARFGGAVRAARAAPPEHARPVCRQRRRRKQAAGVSRGVSYLGGVDRRHALHRGRLLYGAQFRDRLGTDILPRLRRHPGAAHGRRELGYNAPARRRTQRGHLVHGQARLPPAHRALQARPQGKDYGPYRPGAQPRPGGDFGRREDFQRHGVDREAAAQEHRGQDRQVRLGLCIA